MTHELSALEDWAGGLLAPLEPAARRKLNLQVAQELRRSQQQRIKAQQTPEGIAYTPRKQRKEFRNKQGRIKKQKAAMFEKLRTNIHLKIKADPNQIEVGFTGKVARIARVHQFGLRDKVSQTGPEVKYEERKLLGFSETDRDLIQESVLRHIQAKS